eukprot:scpid57555/ scgid31082/ 
MPVHAHTAEAPLSQSPRLPDASSSSSWALPECLLTGVLDGWGAMATVEACQRNDCPQAKLTSNESSEAGQGNECHVSRDRSTTSCSSGTGVVILSDHYCS